CSATCSSTALTSSPFPSPPPTFLLRSTVRPPTLKQQHILNIKMQPMKNLFSFRACPPQGAGPALLTMALLLSTLAAHGQTGDGQAGIQQATNMISGYFDTGTSLMYAIGAIVGLVGAVKVYQKWNAGEPDTG